MSPIAYTAIGAGGMMLLAAVAVCVVEAEFREAMSQVLAVFILGPILMFRPLIRRAPRAIPLSAEALKRFASRTDGSYADSNSAWLLGYRGRGVIIVRKRSDHGWINDVPNSAARARREAKRFNARRGGRGDNG